MWGLGAGADMSVSARLSLRDQAAAIAARRGDGGSTTGVSGWSGLAAASKLGRANRPPSVAGSVVSVSHEYAGSMVPDDQNELAAARAEIERLKVCPLRLCTRAVLATSARL